MLDSELLPVLKSVSLKIESCIAVHSYVLETDNENLRQAEMFK